jgi:hypothetical protein
MPEASVPNDEVSTGSLERVRISFIQRATLEHAAGSEELFVIDLGLAGVFVERKEALPLGATVWIRFPLPGNALPVVAGCRVAWWRPGSAPTERRSLSPGCGLEFVTLSSSDRTRIRDHIAEHCGRHPRARQFARQWPYRPVAEAADEAGSPDDGA